jgi:microcystin-dependent protein
MDAYMGSIMLWPISWAPQSWMFCDGTLLQIQQYSALFALLGTTYGGNGTSNFALPDLRNAFPMGYAAKSPSPVLGAKGGATSVTLTANQIAAHTHPVTLTDPGHVHSVTVPAHTHPFSVPCDSTGRPTTPSPVGAFLSSTSGIDESIGTAAQTTVSPASALYSAAGAGVMGAGTTGQASGNSGNSANAKTLVTAVAAANVGGVPVSTLPPYLALGYIICVSGIFPLRWD